MQATHHFESEQYLTTTLEHYVLLYHHHLSQLALQLRAQIQAMREWQKKRPDLFKKHFCNRPGLDGHLCFKPFPILRLKAFSLTRMEAKMAYYGSRRPTRYNSILKNLDNLTQADLAKIKKKYSEYTKHMSIYHATTADIDKKNKAISEENKKIQVKKNDFEASHITPRIDRLRRIRSSLFKCRAGLIKWALGSYIEINDSLDLPGDKSYVYGGNFDAKIAAPLIQQFKAEKVLLNLHMEEISQIKEIKHLPYPKKPRDYCLLTIAGHKVEVHYDELDIDKLELKLLENKQVIENQKNKEQELKEKHRLQIQTQKKKEQELKARAAKNEHEKRQQAQNIRRRFESQILVLPNCPYCFEKLSMSDAHLDHIYPVSKGGTSREANLVLVCAQCNLAKNNMVLRQFLRMHNYSENEVYERLELLGKDV